jgi:hypothetical protein
MDRHWHRPNPRLNPGPQSGSSVNTPASPPATATPEAKAQAVHAQLPTGGLFREQAWRIAPEPFALDPELAHQLQQLGRLLLQFNRAANLLYRHSLEGKQPPWVAQWLDQGKPPFLLNLQRHTSLRNEWPRVIRPDLLLTDEGPVLTELDAVPGGIGLTAWLNQTYSNLGSNVIGGNHGMLEGFAGIFADAPKVHIVISAEADTYRPEMEWLSARLNPTANPRFEVRDATPFVPQTGAAVYRFYELFDWANVPAADSLAELAVNGQIQLTPPPKPLFEEKMLFALLWNRRLQPFWRRELGERFFDELKQLIPQTWLLDPAPLPPHAAIPGLELSDWRELKTLSQRERHLILKVSGFSPMAWGARGVFLGSDLSAADWAGVVDQALDAFPQSPFILQRYAKPRVVPAAYFDFNRNVLLPMPGRVRLCPYYFVHGNGDAARARLGGVLATICPADKKIIHGMRDAILTPCTA